MGKENTAPNPVAIISKSEAAFHAAPVRPRLAYVGQGKIDRRIHDTTREMLVYPGYREPVPHAPIGPG